MIRRLRFRSLALIFLSSGLFPGCGDDDGVEPELITIADFEGSWNCTSFIATSTADPQIQFNLVLLGGALSATVETDGSFVGSVTYPDPETLQPVTEQVSGVFSLVSQTEVRIEFDTEIPPILENDIVEFTLLGNTLTLHDDTSVFDFDFDGEYELVGVARRFAASRNLEV